MIKIVSFTKEKNCIKNFLEFPFTLYKCGTCPTNKGVEKNILLGTHTLSSHFIVKPFLAYKDGKVYARCIVTLYPGSDGAYVGFFEAKNDIDVTKELIQEVRGYCRSQNRNKIIGPVNSSIWIGSRFKLDNFDEAFTNEPYNLPYYQELFENMGFKICNKYYSNRMNIVKEEYNTDKYCRIRDRLYKAGYSVGSPRPEEFEETLKIIYKMIMDMYKEFPTFHYISEGEFMELFSPLKSIVKYEMISIGYKNNEPRGFNILVPNYGFNTLGKVNVWKLLRILKIKKNPKEYVNLYLGAYDAGLGIMLVYDVVEREFDKVCPAIGALIQEGKVTNKYYEDACYQKMNYALFELDM